MIKKKIFFSPDQEKNNLGSFGQTDKETKPQSWYSPQHQRYHPEGQYYNWQLPAREQSKKNKAYLSVYIAVVISLLVIAIIVLGVYFLIRHFDQAEKPVLQSREETLKEVESSLLPSDTSPSTTSLSETIATETTEETTPHTTASETEISETRPEEPQDFGSDPYGRILSREELDFYPQLRWLSEGISSASKASLAYFVDRQAFETAFYYFSEIALKSEFNDSGDYMLHRWADKVRVEVIGDASEEDLETLDRIIAELNAISSLPEIRRVSENGNYTVTFCLLDEMAYNVSGYVEDNWGFVSIFWNNWGEITSAEAAIAIDVLNQRERNHIILEEFVQGFGMLNDSYDYMDSIFQQDWTTVQDLMPIDWAVIRILYHPVLSSGMVKDPIYKKLVQELFD